MSFGLGSAIVNENSCKFNWLVLSSLAQAALCHGAHSQQGEKKISFTSKNRDFIQFVGGREGCVFL